MAGLGKIDLGDSNTFMGSGNQTGSGITFDTNTAGASNMDLGSLKLSGSKGYSLATLAPNTGTDTTGMDAAFQNANSFLDSQSVGALPDTQADFNAAYNQFQTGGPSAAAGPDNAALQGKYFEAKIAEANANTAKAEAGPGAMSYVTATVNSLAAIGSIYIGFEQLELAKEAGIRADDELQMVKEDRAKIKKVQAATLASYSGKR